MLLILILYVLFASTFTLGKIAIEYIPPILFIAIRMSFAGLLLLGYQYFFNRSQWRYDWRDTSAFAQIAVFLMFIAFVAEFWALQYVSAAKACLLYNLSPFATALLAYLLLAEKLTKKQWCGLIIGFLGFIPIIMQQTGMEQLTVHIGVLSMPELFLLVAVVSSCYGWIIMKQLVKERAYSAIMVNGVTMLWAGILSLITSFVIEGNPRIYAAQSPLYDLSPYHYALLMVIFCTISLVLIAHVVCFNLYSVLLKRYSVTFISFAGFTTPLFAALLDWIVFGQVISIAFFATVGFVMIGLYLFYQDEFITIK